MKEEIKMETCPSCGAIVEPIGLRLGGNLFKCHECPAKLRLTTDGRVICITEKLLTDLLNDVLLVAEMYSLDYPFDSDHRKKHARLFQEAHSVVGNTMDDIRRMIGNK